MVGEGRQRTEEVRVGKERRIQATKRVPQPLIECKLWVRIYVAPELQSLSAGLKRAAWIIEEEREAAKACPTWAETRDLLVCDNNHGTAFSRGPSPSSRNQDRWQRAVPSCARVSHQEDLVGTCSTSTIPETVQRVSPCLSRDRVDDSVARK